MIKNALTEEPNNLHFNSCRLPLMGKTGIVAASQTKRLC